MKTTEINESMKLRFMLLRENGYEVEKAQKCLDFINGGTEEAPAPRKAGKLADGIYLIDTKGNAIRFVGDKTKTINDTAYVGIVMGSHSVAISLHDVSEDEITLTRKRDYGKGHYMDSYMDAVQDWQGKKNTEHLQAVGLNPDIQLKDGEYIPALAEMYLICLNQKAINAAMRFVGGQVIAGWYWSSTEYSETNACLLTLSDGASGSFPKASYRGRVRPVSAFLPINRQFLIRFTSLSVNN